MNRETLLKIIARIEAMKGGFSPDWQAQLANRKAQLAALERGEEVAAPAPTKFGGFNRFGEPIVRRA